MYCDSPSDVGDMSYPPDTVKADSTRGTMSNVDDPAERIGSQPKRTAEAPRQPIIATFPPQNIPSSPNGNPAASLEQVPLVQSDEGARQTIGQRSDDVSAFPSFQRSPELSPIATDYDSDVEASISIQEQQFASNSVPPSPRYDMRSKDSRSDAEAVIREPSSDQEEQEASHNRTKIALLDVHRRKQEVEQQLRRVQMDYEQTLQDHGAGQGMPGQSSRGLTTQAEEQEAAHNETRIALVKAHKEKDDAEQKLDRAIVQFRRQLQAVGIMPEENAQPVWEVDSDGKRTGPLYKDFPNMFRESRVDSLVNRACCRFMLADYEGMATIAFEALEAAESLKFLPLSARCQFMIGIAFYHSRRFSEAHERFGLALDCGDRYGISTECIRDWLEKCEDSMAGKSPANDQSPIRDEHPRDTVRFRASVFFARATNVAPDLRSPDTDSDDEVEEVEGYTSCPSQGYDDESDEIKEVLNLDADDPSELLLEGEQPTPSSSPTRSSALLSEEISQAEDPTEQPSWVDIPTIRSSDTASVPLSQLAPDATEKSVATLPLRSRSSTTINPTPLASSSAPLNLLRQNQIKTRNRATTLISPETAQKPNPITDEIPLSVLTKDMHDVPLQDMGVWVNRSSETRLQEAAKDHRPKRFAVAFILYRSAYTGRIRRMFEGVDEQAVSGIASKSWGVEVPVVRERYEAWAMLERERQGVGGKGGI